MRAKWASLSLWRSHTHWIGYTKRDGANLMMLEVDQKSKKKKKHQPFSMIKSDSS